MKTDDEANKQEIADNIYKLYEENRIANESAANTFWESLSYDDKCNAFHAVMSRLYDGDINQRGSYRYVLYDVFGFGPDMYGRGMDCGYMAIHNSIMTDEQFSAVYKEGGL